MPTITIEVSERAWQDLLQRAQREEITPEQVAQRAIEAGLRGVELSPGLAKDTFAVTAPESTTHFSRGSAQRVLATLQWLDQQFPLEDAPPPREAIDAYLQAERDAWDDTAKE